MNQLCKVCDEPAAGFHFGAFTCEGCKSFFGRSYNNISSITPCKNSGRCVINKKNRTSCKACRLKKCISVGMSKGGSRYGRRSNWFKIHCLLEQEQNDSRRMNGAGVPAPRPGSWPEYLGPPPGYYHRAEAAAKEEACFEEYKNSASPATSSPESHNSDSSVDVGERVKPRLSFYKEATGPYLPFGGLAGLGLQSILHGQVFLPPMFPTAPHPLLFPPGLVYPRPEPPLPPPSPETDHKRLHLDAILRSQRSPAPAPAPAHASDHPMDLSVRVSAMDSEDEDEDITVDDDTPTLHPKLIAPLDLTTKVQ